MLDILTVKLEVFRGRTASYNNRKVQIVQQLMNGLMPKLLIGLERKVTQYGRDALWSAIQENRPFFSMVTTPYLHLFMNADIAFIEELAFHYYDNKEEKELLSLPKPQEFSLIPPEMDGGAQWSYDCKTRVVIADFSRVNVVTWNEKLYLGKLMERDDISVVCEGLFGQLENVEVFLDVVGHALGKEPQVQEICSNEGGRRFL